jgi:hypothetical protein
MQESVSIHASDAANAFGAPRRPVRRLGLAVVGIIVIARLLLVALALPSGRALLGIGSPYPSCTEAGISTSAGR